MNNKIDFVIMWVDGNDPKWQEEKRKYNVSKDADDSVYRYRDFDLLKYWFRGVEKFAPWVNKIHFVTYGHIPSWLDTTNKKLSIVKHDDFIPSKYLPTFNANTIELNLHRIKDLSENFVLFNDDVFLIKKTTEKDFFVNNIPKELAALNVHCPKKSLISQYFGINDVNIINEHFNSKESIRSNLSKWINIKNGGKNLRTLVLLGCPRFPGFYQQHIASSYNKKTFETLWNKEPVILNNTSTHKFRTTTDVNQWLFKEWQIASGKFIPRSIRFGKSYYIDRDGLKKTEPQIIKYITKQKGKMISINDGYMEQEEFEELIIKLKNAFDSILKEKSSFEK